MRVYSLQLRVALPQLDSLHIFGENPLVVAALNLFKVPPRMTFSRLHS
jgi:hypothetical protein